MFWIIATGAIYSQQTQLSGKVSDENGDGIPGVTVVLKNATGAMGAGTITDALGNYRLNVKEKSGVLHFSFIGMEDVDRPFNGSAVINVKMGSSTFELGEAVVVGYGVQKKESVVGAISTVSSKDLLQSPASNLSNALAGRLAGLTTVQNTGQPGKDDASLYIRGRSTWVNAKPLIIVDGIERENYTQVDANEVETISILKDASATAVYGVRGANGVLIITTKRGAEQKPEVSLSAEFGLQQPTRLPKFLRSYETALLRNESYLNDGYPADQLPFQPAALEAFRTKSDPYHYPDVDWYDEVLRKVSPQSRYNINVRGGTKAVKYFVSAGYFNQEGLFNTNLHSDYNTNFAFKRFNYRSNLDIDVTRDLKVTLNIAARLEDSNEPGSTGYANAEKQNAFAPLTRTPPYETPVFQANGKPGIGNMGLNPWLTVNGFGYTTDKKDVVETSLMLNYDLHKITKGLTTKILLSFDSYYTEQKRFSQNTAAYRLDSAPGEQDVYTVVGEDTELKYDGGGMGNYRKTYGEASLGYNRDFGRNKVTGLVLLNMEDKRYGGDLVPYRFMGLVSRLTYSFDNRYLSELNMGYNGSENFARGNRFGLFPSLSLGWLMSNEEFFRDNVDWVSSLKLRGSIGKVGNDRIGGDRFMYLEEYSTRQSWISPSLPYFGSSGSTAPIIFQSRTANPYLTWETALKYNAGLDLYLLRNRLSVVVDLFLENRKDILMDRESVQQYVGIKPAAGNLGKTQNKGCDIEIGYRDKTSNGLGYWVKGIYSFARNKVVYKDEPANKPEWQKAEGNPINQFFGYKVLGFFDVDDFDSNGDLLDKYPRQLIGQAPLPGDFRYADVNGDHLVDDRDKVAIGYSDIPEGTFGFSYGFDFKNFDFSMNFQGAYNSSLNVTSELMYEFCERGKVQDFHKDRWAYYTDPFTGQLIDTRATAKYPRLHSQSSSPNWTLNDSFLYNSSYLKLRNIEIGYTLSATQLKRIGIKDMRLYVNGANLYTWCNVPQVDPEGPGYGSNQERGWNYPQLRIYNVGLNITF